MSNVIDINTGQPAYHTHDLNALDEIHTAIVHLQATLDFLVERLKIANQRRLLDEDPERDMDSDVC